MDIPVLSSCASLLGVDDIICRTELFNMSLGGEKVGGSEGGREGSRGGAIYLMVGLCSQDLLRQLSSN